MRKLLTLIRHDLNDSKIGLISVVVIALSIGALFGAFYPTIRENADGIAMLAQGEIAALFFNISPDDVADFDFSDYNVYISTEYFSFFWAVLFVPFLISWGVKMAGQAEKGTLALLLAHPVGRTEAINSQLLSLAAKAALTAFAFIVSAGLPALFIEDTNLDLVAWLRVGVFYLVIFITISYIAFAASIVTMSKLKGIWITTVIIVLGYLFNTISNLVSEVEFLKYASLWHYMGNTTKQLQGEPLYTLGFLVFLLVAIICIVIPVLVFDKKNLPNG